MRGTKCLFPTPLGIEKFNRNLGCDVFQNWNLRHITTSRCKKVLYIKLGCVLIQLSQSGQSLQCRQTEVEMKFVSFVDYRLFEALF